MGIYQCNKKNTKVNITFLIKTNINAFIFFFFFTPRVQLSVTKPTTLCLSEYSVLLHRYLHLCLPVMLPWELPPRTPIGQPEEVAAGERVHVRGKKGRERRGRHETERQTFRYRRKTKEQ